MDRIIAPNDWVPVTLGGGAVNLVTLGGHDRSAMALLPTGSGTVTITTQGSGVTERVLPVLNGVILFVETISVVSVSGPTALHAGYP